jgi:ApaG protein
VSTSEAVTRGVRVKVNCQYSAERSDPSRREYFFLYTVRITNEGEEPVQLLNRHWVITNAHGKVEEVRGPGVVGQQPRLGRGESFEYTSGCPLDTTFGSMRGSYELVALEEHARFDVEIAPFALRQDDVFH